MRDFDSNEEPIRLPDSSQGGSPDGARLQPPVSRWLGEIADPRQRLSRRLVEAPGAIVRRRRVARRACPRDVRVMVIGRAPARRRRPWTDCPGDAPRISELTLFFLRYLDVCLVLATAPFVPIAGLPLLGYLVAARGLAAHSRGNDLRAGARTAGGRLQAQSRDAGCWHDGSHLARCAGNPRWRGSPAARAMGSWPLSCCSPPSRSTS